MQKHILLNRFRQNQVKSKVVMCMCYNSRLAGKLVPVFNVEMYTKR